VSFADTRLVVKSALPRLRVAQEWESSPARVLVEADALRCAGAIRPANVPRVIDIDEQNLVLVMTAGDPGWTTWKSRLLEGTVDVGLAEALGEALADWHSKTAADDAALRRFAERNYFFELRISPFFLRVAEVHRDLAGTIYGVVERMSERASCLVHGDFSPKNFLVDTGSFWVLDWETAHTGDPTFDLAFLVSHLACKAIHRQSDAARYQRCAEQFVSTYCGRSTLVVDPEELVAQAGCLVLARVDGKSPVDYFDDAQREAARALGRRVVQGHDLELSALFKAT
jgi:aminoglycoside phosphotransferase (APT) family kinase protein